MKLQSIFLSHKDMMLYKLVLLFILNTFNPLEEYHQLEVTLLCRNLPKNNNITSKLIKKTWRKKNTRNLSLLVGIIRENRLI